MGRNALLLSSMAIACGHSEARLALEGPYQHGRLAIYLVRGEETDARSYLTLDEALASGKVLLRELGDGSVNTLEVRNISDDWVFLHVGDVIRGGKQDRTLGADLILEPQSPFQPVDAFCVEHGRWSASGGSAAGFEANTAVVSGRALKLGIQHERDQNRVWDAVAALESVAAAYVTPSAPPAALSPTGTYNAIVENDVLRAHREDYVTTLLRRIEASSEALGVVASIDGDIVGADIYSSRTLFRKLAPKLLDSYAQEAILTASAREETPPPAKESVEAFLAEQRAASSSDESLSRTMLRQTRESRGAVVFDYRFGADRTPVHSSYVSKKEEPSGYGWVTSEARVR